jgi:hypothetical protein
MEKVKRFKGPIIVAVVLLLISLMIITVILQSTPKMLYPEEIRDYEGQDLSSINDFRENSIRGPQYVNESQYNLTIIRLDNSSIEYSYNDIINEFQKYQKVTILYCVEGWYVKILWEGFLLEDLLNETGIDPEHTCSV